jgi:hypothetical protein
MATGMPPKPKNTTVPHSALTSSSLGCGRTGSGAGAGAATGSTCVSISFAPFDFPKSDFILSLRARNRLKGHARACKKDDHFPPHVNP